MSETSIQWTNQTWNPVAGCSIISPGCKNCYAMRMAGRLEAMGQAKYHGLTIKKNGHRVWTGKIELDHAALSIPLKRKKPTMYFVNSMSDLFHEDVPFAFVDRVFAVMAICPQHTFQILTKRPERMAEYLAGAADDLHDRAFSYAMDMANGHISDRADYVEELSRNGQFDKRPNVWLGTSVEDQQRADERIPHLLKCPAAVRFLSCEPLLSAIDLDIYLFGDSGPLSPQDEKSISWVIVGGESGPGARPMNIEWARSIVKQCHAAGVSCFVKQFGAFPFDSAGETICEFESHLQWVHKARSWLGGVSGGGKRYKTKEQAICVDGKGRVCRIGADFDRAERENAFPVRAFPIIYYADHKGGDPAEWSEDLRIREFPVKVTP